MHHVDLIHLFDYYPVRDRICFYSSIGAIIAISRTCKQLSQTYQDLLATQWNIDSKLSRFVADPRRFRMRLRDTEAVISGSFAVQFFDRTVYRDADLDVFVEHGNHVKGLCKHLTSTEGYKLAYTRDGPKSDGLAAGLDPEEEADGDIYDIKMLRRVRTYVKTSHKSRSVLKIQIVETTKMPIAAILSGFYATHVVNVITWCRAYAIFPIPTFVQLKGYMLESLSRVFVQSLLRKWAARGWEFDQTLWPEEETCFHSIQRRRRVGDRHTWKISFDISNFESLHMESPEDHGMRNNVFQMEKRRASIGDSWHTSPAVPHYEIDIGCSSFRSSVLRHKYVAPVRWMEFAGSRLDRAAYMQFVTKIEPGRWPEGTRSLLEPTREEMRSRLSRGLHDAGWISGSADGPANSLTTKSRYFDRPENWRYYDEDMTRWYDAWNQQEADEEREGRG